MHIASPTDIPFKARIPSLFTLLSRPLSEETVVRVVVDKKLGSVIEEGVRSRAEMTEIARSRGDCVDESSIEVILVVCDIPRSMEWADFILLGGVVLSRLIL